MKKAKEKRLKNEAIKKKMPRKTSPSKKVSSKSKSPQKRKESKSPSKSPGKTKKGKKEVEEEVPEEKDPLEMTEEEIYLKKLSDEANVDLLYLSEDQMKQRLEEAERKKYGRHWIWEGYFNEKNQSKWLATAENLKHINDQVIEDVQDYILLEGFKPMKEDKVQKMIDEDQKERI